MCGTGLESRNPSCTVPYRYGSRTAKVARAPYRKYHLLSTTMSHVFSKAGSLVRFKPAWGDDTLGVQTLRVTYWIPCRLLFSGGGRQRGPHRSERCRCASQ